MTAALFVWFSGRSSAQDFDSPILIFADGQLEKDQGLKPLTTGDITLEKFGRSNPRVADPSSDDKWALTDEDRMTEEEMDEELFGKETATDKKDDQEDADRNDATGKRDAQNDDKVSSKKETPAATKQSIESYLKNINTLTVETSTPPARSIDGVDTPMRMVPPQAITTVQSSAVARLRFQTPDIYHQPLYFEDTNLERHGVHRCCRQPFASARKFTTDTLALPRNLRKQPLRSCVHRENQRYNQPSLLPTIH